MPLTVSLSLPEVQSACTGPDKSIGALTGRASRPSTSTACMLSGRTESVGALTSVCHPEPQLEWTAAMLLPGVEDGCRGGEIVLIKASPSIRSGEKPLVRVARLPGSRGEEGNHGGASARTCQKPGEEIAARTIERNHRASIHLPGIITGTAVKSWR